MNSKTAMVVSLVLMLASLTFWSISVLRAEPAVTVSAVSAVSAASTTTTRQTTESVDSATLRLANDANEEAASKAARSIQSSNRLDLDIRLISATELALTAR